MKRYLIARHSMLRLPDKVWKFRNPWSRIRYRVRECVLMNPVVLPLLIRIWRLIYKLARQKKNYYQMKMSCKIVSGKFKEKSSV